jgi:hypothetical protein
MGDEKEKESQNQDPTDELSKEDLEKVQGGAFNSFVNFGDIKGETPEPPPKPRT